jgi:hypothetical protein
MAGVGGIVIVSGVFWIVDEHPEQAVTAMIQVSSSFFPIFLSRKVYSD